MASKVLASNLLGLLGIGSEPTVQEDHDLELSGVSGLEARTFNGTIRVKAGSETPHLSVRRKGDVSVTLERRGDLLQIEARKNNPICVNCGASFELTLPQGMRLRLHSSNGTIEVEGTTASLEAHTSNGGVIARGTGAAELELHTSNGRVTVVGATGRVSAKTSNGGIEIRGLEGRVQARTSNGAVILEDISLAPGSQNSAGSSNGAVKLIGVRSPGGLEAEGHTSNGGVRVELEGAEVQVRKHHFTARQKGENPARLKLETSNGSITVR